MQKRKGLIGSFPRGLLPGELDHHIVQAPKKAGIHRIADKLHIRVIYGLPILVCFLHESVADCEGIVPVSDDIAVADAVRGSLIENLHIGLYAADTGFQSVLGLFFLNFPLDIRADGNSY